MALNVSFLVVETLNMPGARFIFWHFLFAGCVAWIYCWAGRSGGPHIITWGVWVSVILFPVVTLGALAAFFYNIRTNSKLHDIDRFWPKRWHGGFIIAYSLPWGILIYNLQVLSGEFIFAFIGPWNVLGLIHANYLRYALKYEEAMRKFLTE